MLISASDLAAFPWMVSEPWSPWTVEQSSWCQANLGPAGKMWQLEYEQVLLDTEQHYHVFWRFREYQQAVQFVLAWG